MAFTEITGFTEVAAGVFVLRYPVLDCNVTLVSGEGGALVVDTLSTAAQAAFLLGEIRKITPDPLTVVNTHHHFDHCFGNAAFTGSEIWAHEANAARVQVKPEIRIREVYEEFGALDGMTGLDEVTIVPPTRTVRSAEVLDVGGRLVTLRYLGRGHTDNDLVVTVDGAVLTGDLIEEGAAPSFGDSYPLEWAETVAAVLELCGDGPVVPGHGAVVDKAFVAAQHADLAAVDWAIRDGHADDSPQEAVAARLVKQWALLSPEQATLAVKRGYAELSGRA
ncbi:MBL fold metallo-hydrolase [Longispora albida]|uniref:MBL fold metallo-hydrolase n=1 Tax=Longispora albida TaxID=203523 RepID=UPI0003764364|nr:MBL fold metallo-hydrolase [Longispora albida]